MNIDKTWWERQLQWQTATIQARGTGKRSSRNRWIFVLALLAAVGFVLHQSQEELLGHFYAGEYEEMHELLIVLFPIIFVASQIKKRFERSRFGDTPLTMDPFPAIRGEGFGGTVEINKSVEGLQFKAELVLIEHTEIEADDYMESSSETIWRMPLELHQERSMMGVRLLLRGEIPADRPPSEPPNSESYHSWDLSIYSHDKAFKRHWPVPVIADSNYS